MEYDVFICCSEQDKLYADAICHIAEKDGLKVYHPYRDQSYVKFEEYSIADSIKNCKVLVYILSEYSNTNEEMINQINTAVSKRLDIITVSVAQVAPSLKVKYYTAGGHWMDCSQLPFNENLDVILVWVHECISRKKNERRSRVWGFTIKHNTIKRIMFTALTVLLFAASVYIYKVMDRAPVDAFKHVIQNNTYIRGFFLSPAGDWYAEPLKDGSIKIMEVDSGTCIRTLKTSFSSAVDICYCNDNHSVLVMCNKEGAVYDIDSGELTGSIAFDIAEDSILVAYGNNDERGSETIDLLFINAGSSQLIRYDYPNNMVLLKKAMPHIILDGVTKDRKYLILHDNRSELLLLDNHDFTKPYIRGAEAHEICKCNIEGDIPTKFSENGEYYAVYDFKKTMRVKILDHTGTVVYQTNIDGLTSVWFQKDHKILMNAGSPISRIDYLSGTKEKVFSDTFLKKYPEVRKIGIITSMTYEQQTDLGFFILTKSKDKKGRLFVLDENNDRLLAVSNIPSHNPVINVMAVGDRIYIIYFSEQGVSLDIGRITYKDGKQYISSETDR